MEPFRNRLRNFKNRIHFPASCLKRDFETIEQSVTYLLYVSIFSGFSWSMLLLVIESGENVPSYLDQPYAVLVFFASFRCSRNDSFALFTSLKRRQTYQDDSFHE